MVPEGKRELMVPGVPSEPPPSCARTTRHRRGGRRRRRCWRRAPDRASSRHRPRRPSRSPRPPRWRRSTSRSLRRSAHRHRCGRRQIITRELPNGLKIVVVEQHELPLVDFVLQVRSGGESDPAGKTGTAALVAAMLTEGTTTRTALQIADQAAYLGVQLNATQRMGAEQRLAPHPDRAARQRARAVRRRRAPAELPGGGPRAGAQGAPDVAAAASRPRAGDRRPCVRERRVRGAAPVRTSAGRHRGVARGNHARRGAALLRDLLSAEQRDPARRRRRQTGRRGAPRSRAVRGLGAGDRPDAGDQHVERREGHDGRDRRQAGGGAVVVPARRRRCTALDERLLPAAGDEHDPRAGRSRADSIRTCARRTATRTARARASDCGARPDRSSRAPRW